MLDSATQPLAPLRALEGGYLARTVAAFCVVLIALLWIFVGLELKSDRERTVARVMEGNGNLARAFEEHVVRTLRNADQTLLVVKSLYAKLGSKFDLAQYATDGMIHAQPFNIVSIVDAKGDMIQASTAFERISLRDREFFQFHANNDSGQLHISKPLLGRTTGKWSLYLTRRITAPDGAFGGMAVVAVDPQYFSNFYNQIDLGKDDVVTLVGRDGLVRARQTHDDATVGQDVSSGRLLSELVPASPSGSYVETSRIDGITRILSYRTVRDFPLVMLVGTGEATALAGFRARQAVYLWGSGIVSAIIALFAALLTFQASGQAQTGRRLQQSEARFRAIFDHAAMGMGERALDGRWLRVNRQLCDLLGYTGTELLAMTVLDHTHPADRAATVEHSDKLRANKSEGSSMEKRYLRKDGSAVWVRSVAALIRDSHGQPDSVIAIVEDISAQKSAEAEAKELRVGLERRVEQRTAELAAANRGLESFSYSVSHDLRTPLRAISGFAQILSRRHRETLNEEGRRYMDNIVRAGAQMGELIEDLLNYSRLGRKAVKLDGVDLGATLAAVIENLQPHLRERRAEVRVSPRLPMVRADSTLLGQIFSNLLENALKYCAPGVSPAIEVSGRSEEGQVIVSVKDNGIGIAPEHHESIFGVFQRLHNYDDYPGTGIGLATVKQAVELMDGKVWVESAVGVGSVFHVRLQSGGSSAG